MSLDVLCSFKSLFTTRVYEILRTQYYRFDREQCDQLIVPRPPKNPYTIAELKFTLNVVDANASKAVKRLVEQGRFEEALAEIKDAPLKIGVISVEKYLKLRKKSWKNPSIPRSALIMSRLRAGRAERLQESVSL